ncbi:MAG: protein kinase [Acidimicrobiia bacterium]|nr:protein kinase [Acidimicrobiia bacterium]
MTQEPAGGIDLGIHGISDAVEIGAGGFGIVYRAVEEDLGRTVAVKVLLGNLDEPGRYRFERERRAMGRLSGHPNIVTVYRGGYTDAGNAYLVMEFLDRGSLADRLATVGPLGWEEAVKFTVQLSGALETSHRAGVLHRDIKPGNILLSNLGNAKLCDFGIARLQGAPETKSMVVTASLSHAPPDIVSGARPDARSDVYSLASTMFELVAATPPFVRPTDESMVPILARIAQDPVPRLPETQLPGPVFEVIERAMAKDPAARPGTAAELGRLLVAAQHRLGQPPTPIPIEAVAAEAEDDNGRSYIPFPETGSGPLPAPRASSPADRPDPTGNRAGVTGGATGTGPAPPTVVTGPGGEQTGAAAERTAISDQHDPASWAPPAARSAATSGPTDIAPDTSGPSAPAPPAGEGGPPTPGHPTQAADDSGPLPTVPSLPDTAVGEAWHRQGPARPGRPSWIVPALIAGAIAVVIAVLLVVVVSGDDPETATEDTTTTTEAEAATTTEVTFAGSGADDYPTYRTLSDETGSITIDVPTEWDDTLTALGTDGLPQLAAAPQLTDGYIGTYTTAGMQVAVVAIPEPAEGATPPSRSEAFELVLGRFSDPACTAEPREDVRTPYIGRAERLTNCDGIGTTLIHVVFIDGTSNLVALLRIQILTDRDLVAADTIRSSLRLKDNVPE